jgi:hypothetical protein
MKNYIKCSACSKDFKHKHSSTGKYCSNVCAQEGRRNISKERFDEGKLSNRSLMKKILIERTGYNCDVCKQAEWMSQPIPLELDHIDGNAGNNLPVNVRKICPNCHAQTPTHKAKNKGNGRGSRGLPWY